MSGKGRRDSLDDFKEDSFRPLFRQKPKGPKSQQNPPAAAKSVLPSTPKDNSNTRKCALCDLQLSEDKYSDHFAACMKQRNAKAAAIQAAKKGKIRPITDFIKPSPGKPGDTSKSGEPSTSSSSTSVNEGDSQPATETANIVLPYCPVCGRVIKTERAYAPHLKQCAKRYNVAPDLLLELSKKQMTLQVEPPQPKKAPVVGKKRPMKFFEIPSSTEDEELQLAVALSASELETHVSHLPIASIAENSEEADPSRRPVKRIKRQANIEPLRRVDVAEARSRLVELMNQRFQPSSTTVGSDRVPLLVSESRLSSEESSRLFHLACSSPGKLVNAIRDSRTIHDMPVEFVIDTTDFEAEIDIGDLKSVSMATSADAQDSEKMDEEPLADSTLRMAQNFQQQANLITSTLVTVKERTEYCNQATQTEDISEIPHNRLSQNMLLLLRNEETFDYHFIASDGTLVGAHKLIVFAHCPGLKKDSTPTTKRLSSHTVDSIESFLEFIYAGIVEPTQALEFEQLLQELQTEDLEAESLVNTSPSLDMDITNSSYHKTSPSPGGLACPEPTETPALPGKQHDSVSPIVLSSDSHVDESNESNSNVWVESGSSNHRMSPLSPVEPESKPCADESGDSSPLPPIQTCDEWIDMENYNYADCCFASDVVPLSQNRVTEEENALIAEFDRIQQTEVAVQPDTFARPSPIVVPSKGKGKAKLTAAGKSRPRVSIVGLTSVTVRSKDSTNPSTPATGILKMKTTPPYSQMATPNLTKLLGKYGVRKLPKKHMVLKLKEIHSVLKPKQPGGQAGETSAGPSASSRTEAFSLEQKKPKPSHWKARRKCLSDSESSDDDDSENEAEMTIEPNALSMLDDVEEDDDEEERANENEEDVVSQFFSQSQTKKKKSNKKAPKIVLTGQEFTDGVAAFIRSDAELYNDILEFKPLPFKDIYSKVRNVGNIACSKQQLVDFLDQQCVTFRLTPGKSHRPPPPAPVEKKPKHSKSQSQSQSQA